MASVAPSAAGQLPLPMLAEAGVRVGLGEDGQRDYWSPYGNTDMLDRTWQLAFTHGFRRDELIGHCLAIATVGGASVLDPSATRLMARRTAPALRRAILPSCCCSTARRWPPRSWTGAPTAP
jgi:cytosine deaminase